MKAEIGKEYFIPARFTEEIKKVTCVGVSDKSAVMEHRLFGFHYSRVNINENNIIALVPKYTLLSKIKSLFKR
jgi:hypothetical protein